MKITDNLSTTIRKLLQQNLSGATCTIRCDIHIPVLETHPTKDGFSQEENGANRSFCICCVFPPICIWAIGIITAKQVIKTSIRVSNQCIWKNVLVTLRQMTTIFGRFLLRAKEIYIHTYIYINYISNHQNTYGLSTK